MQALIRLILSRTRYRLVCSLFFCGMAAACGANAEIVCEGTYDGHLQGVDMEPNQALYWSFTKTLLKTDLEGKPLKKVVVPSHHGDLTYHDGKVYVAVNLGKFNEEPGQADSWVYVYDAHDLTLLAKHPVQEAVHGAGGMAWHNGHFFVIGGLPRGYHENYAYEYDADFVFVKRHVLDSGYTLMGIQTACRWQGYWWFGCYGEPKVLLKADDQFHVLGKYRENWSVGIAGFSDTQCLRGMTGAADVKGMYFGKLELDTPGKESDLLATPKPTGTP